MKTRGIRVNEKPPTPSSAYNLDGIRCSRFRVASAVIAFISRQQLSAECTACGISRQAFSRKFLPGTALLTQIHPVSLVFLSLSSVIVASKIVRRRALIISHPRPLQPQKEPIVGYVTHRPDTARSHTQISFHGPCSTQGHHSPFLPTHHPRFLSGLAPRERHLLRT